MVIIQVVSLFGILVGISLFIFFAFKHINMLLNTVIVSIVICVFSSMPIYETITTLYMSTFSNFLNKFFLIFALGALFGKLMSQSGASTGIATAFLNIAKRSKHKNLLALMFVPVMTGLLAYIGVNSYIIIFTVLGMSRDLFQECDIPWRFYSYGTSGAIGVMFAAGTLQTPNILLSEICGTSLYASPILSIIGLFVFWTTLLIICALDLASAKRKGEGFMKTGAAMFNHNLGSKEQKDIPPVQLAFLPILAIISISVLTGNVIYALIGGSVLCIVLFKKNISHLSKSMEEGISSAYAPIINVASTMSVATVIGATSGFAIINNFILSLPALYGGVALTLLISFLTANPNSVFPAFGKQMVDNIVGAGYAPHVAHRILTASGFTNLAPHSAGIVNGVALTKNTYLDCFKIYVKGVWFTGAITLVVLLTCVNFGIGI